MKRSRLQDGQAYIRRRVFHKQVLFQKWGKFPIFKHRNNLRLVPPQRAKNACGRYGAETRQRAIDKRGHYLDMFGVMDELKDMGAPAGSDASVSHDIVTLFDEPTGRTLGAVGAVPRVHVPAVAGVGLSVLNLSRYGGVIELVDCPGISFHLGTYRANGTPLIGKVATEDGLARVG